MRGSWSSLPERSISWSGGEGSGDFPPGGFFLAASEELFPFREDVDTREGRGGDDKFPLKTGIGGFVLVGFTSGGRKSLSSTFGTKAGFVLADFKDVGKQSSSLEKGNFIFGNFVFFKLSLLVLTLT